MENSHLQVWDSENSQYDVTWKSDVADVIWKYLVNMRVTLFSYKASDAKKTTTTKELLYYKHPRLFLV